MDKENQVVMSLEEFCQFTRAMLNTKTTTPAGCQPIGPFVTIHDRCKLRWPLATKDDERRIRDVCLGMYRERLNRDPYKLTGHINGTFVIEEEHLAILDRAIDIVRNEAEERKAMPLFGRRHHRHH